MNGAQAVVQMMEAYSIEYIFGVPGDTSLPLYRVLYERRHKIRHVLARDERSAGFMADAYSRLTHRPGVCECPSGAGALYSIPGIAEANSSSIPVILLTSGVSLAGEGKGTITELDHHKLFEPVTKWSSFLKHTDKIPETLRRAFRIATTGRQSGGFVRGWLFGNVCRRTGDPGPAKRPGSADPFQQRYFRLD